MKLLLDCVVTDSDILNEKKELSNSLTKRKHIGVVADLCSVDHENS